MRELKIKNTLTLSQKLQETITLNWIKNKNSKKITG